MCVCAGVEFNAVPLLPPYFVTDYQFNETRIRPDYCIKNFFLNGAPLLHVIHCSLRNSRLNKDEFVGLLDFWVLFSVSL